MYPIINMKATGTRIRQIMEQRKLTVKDVQKYLNLSSVQSIYHWLKGQSMPTVDNLYALSELFELPVDAIIVGNRKYRMCISRGSFYDRMRIYYKYFMRLQALEDCELSADIDMKIHDFGDVYYEYRDTFGHVYHFMTERK